MFKSTKTYDHNTGLSCAFRQWRATHSHCHLVHGYALAFKFVFGCADRDARGWVQDFGDLDHVKERLKYWFDHTTAVAADDPKLEWFKQAQEQGILKLRVMDSVGCESFAKFAFGLAETFVASKHPTGRVWVESCEVSEHAGNSAVYIKE